MPPATVDAVAANGQEVTDVTAKPLDKETLTLTGGEFITIANRWESKAGGRAAMNKGKSKWKALFRRNPADVSRRNVADYGAVCKGISC